MSTQLYLTRHGETVWNTKKLMQGWKDSPLTDRGIKQAKQLAERLSDVSLDAIYSSSSNRAIHTAEIIRGEKPLDVITYNHLRELSFGNWEGKTFEENEKENPEEWLSFWETPHLFSHNTIEPFVHVQERMVKTVQNIINQHPFENVLIVTHSIALKLLMNYFEKNTLVNLWSTPAIPSASLTLVKVNNKFSEVVYKYDTTHMKQ
ncbi:histidine phosphatase family protein [Bacillus sp. MUM 13]|uniref:histidine phosphatase family protein n=1 Tax=Bacillus sp. MUM 13 TaxID=1678001 RepID=UPI0008F5C8AB|nr:histidine phosphatase family protein [Bacillus sp. MUM 13]OIK13644.1 fructose-2,6-bisphosphatase [Bacillus sp. MUM 13]